jgi:hypothetical protein
VATVRTNGNGDVVVKAQISKWKLKQEERALFARAEEALPNWRLADKARRMLADFIQHFSSELPKTVEQTSSELDPTVARRAAVIGAGAIGVRSAGSALVLLSAGYGPEAASPLRRLLEAKLNVQAILDDETGEYAIRYLQGRSRGTSKLAQKYGNVEEIDLLSVLTHADVRGLITLHVGPPRRSTEMVESTLSVMPFHKPRDAEFLLHAVAYECGLMCGGLVDAFGVGFEMPPWVGEQLVYMRDKVKAARVQRERQEPAPKPKKAKKASSTASLSKRKAARRGRRRASPHRRSG